MEGPRPADDPRPICVVSDTNVWRSELLLRTARGVALLYKIRRSGGVLGMPEVIEREIVKQAKVAGIDFTTEIEKNFRVVSQGH